jgi:hypothetical protein
MRANILGNLGRARHTTKNSIALASSDGQGLQEVNNGYI